jgi:hypothetical protein
MYLKTQLCYCLSLFSLLKQSASHEIQTHYRCSSVNYPLLNMAIRSTGENFISLEFNESFVGSVEAG